MKNLLLIFLSILALSACTDDDSAVQEDILTQGEDDVAEDELIEEDTPFESATYEISFLGTWSDASHPFDFPDGRDHFSSAVGMVHQEGAQIFNTGDLASEGIEDMAENGENGALATEVDELVEEGSALSYFSGGGLSNGQAERTFEIEVNTDYPFVTIVSMIAPSPDWFVAVRDVNLFVDGQFVDELTLDAPSYDAGTDSGPSFTSPNEDTDPAEPISRITDAPLGDGEGVEPAVAMFRFVRVDTN